MHRRPGCSDAIETNVWEHDVVNNIFVWLIVKWDLLKALLGAVRFIYQPSYAVQHGVYFQGTECPKNIMEGGDQACSIPAKQESVKCLVPFSVASRTNIAGCSGHSLLRASFGNTQNIWASHRAGWKSEAHFMPPLILLQFPEVTVRLFQCLSNLILKTTAVSYKIIQSLF